mmetsp:Transcript_1283/g.3653  ORF Transcript_1283/g.3653 Transcript_1283/m.3653 type:complete len:296 (+) Transcript_1283:385-1272(+)
MAWWRGTERCHSNSVAPAISQSRRYQLRMQCCRLLLPCMLPRLCWSCRWRGSPQLGACNRRRRSAAASHYCIGCSCCWSHSQRYRRHHSRCCLTARHSKTRLPPHCSPPTTPTSRLHRSHGRKMAGAGRSRGGRPAGPSAGPDDRRGPGGQPQTTVDHRVGAVLRLEPPLHHNPAEAVVARAEPNFPPGASPRRRTPGEAARHGVRGRRHPPPSARRRRPRASHWGHRRRRGRRGPGARGQLQLYHRHRNRTSRRPPPEMQRPRVLPCRRPLPWPPAPPPANTHVARPAIKRSGA